MRLPDLGQGRRKNLQRLWGILVRMEENVRELSPARDSYGLPWSQREPSNAGIAGRPTGLRRWCLVGMADALCRVDIGVMEISRYFL